MSVRACLAYLCLVASATTAFAQQPTSTQSVPQPRTSGLTKFTFFCSRGWEGNVEQCWLHMGYFAKRAEAEKWLAVLKRLYPQAFVTQADVTFAPEHHATLHMARRRERLP